MQERNTEDPSESIEKSHYRVLLHKASLRDPYLKCFVCVNVKKKNQYIIMAFLKLKYRYKNQGQKSIIRLLYLVIHQNRKTVHGHVHPVGQSSGYRQTDRQTEKVTVCLRGNEILKLIEKMKVRPQQR